MMVIFNKDLFLPIIVWHFVQGYKLRGTEYIICDRGSYGFYWIDHKGGRRTFEYIIEHIPKEIAAKLLFYIDELDV